MGKSKRETEKAAKKSKVVTMPLRDGGKDAEETEKGNKKSAGRKPKSAKEGKPDESKKTEAENLAKDDYKGAKKRLRHWVQKVVKERGNVIAGKLMDQTEQGNLHSTEILLELMEKKKKKSGADGDDLDGPSLAEQLMAGPTWEEVLEARRKAKEEEEGEAASAASC